MEKIRARKIILSGAASVLLANASAFAVDIPTEGKINVVFTVTGTTKPLKMGGRTAVQVEVNLVGYSPDGKGLFHNATAHCMGLRLVDPKAPSYSGYCLWVDTDGDQVFEKYEVVAFNADGSTKGKGTFLGGTGKYETISSGYDYTVQPLKAAADGTVAGIGTKTGTYKLK